MEFKVKKPLSDEEALGRQNRGVRTPTLAEEEKKLLYEYRHDMRLPENVGMQFVPDSDLPWLREDVLKLNLGTYRKFTAGSWIQVARPNEEKRDFNIPYEALAGVQKEKFQFVYAPYILSEVENPAKLVELLHDLLTYRGVLGVVEYDRDELIRQGRGFENARFNLSELGRLIQHAEFADWAEIDFREFDLAGGDSAHIGFFAQR